MPKFPIYLALLSSLVACGDDATPNMDAGEDAIADAPLRDEGSPDAPPGDGGAGDAAACEDSRCGEECVDTTTDPAHCGGCGMACPAGGLCQASECVSMCDAPFVACDASCVDVQRDLQHCGSCGRACDANSTCSAGECVTGDVVLIDAMRVEHPGGTSAEITFEVPERTVALFVTIDGQAERAYNLAYWTNGDGAVYLEEGWHIDDPTQAVICATCPLRTRTIDGAFSAMAPNNELTDPVPGTHRLAVLGLRNPGAGDFIPVDGSVEVSVVARVAGALPTTGTLDVNFYYTGSAGWTAASAPAEETMVMALAAMREAFAGAGISVGDIRHVDMPRSDRVMDTTYGPGNELGALLASSAGGPPGVNVFFVDQIGPAAGMFATGGYTPTIPIPTLQGTVSSGLTIALPIFVAGMARPRLLGLTIAHEIAHGLGLFHSTSTGGELHDLIADTPVGDMENLLHFASTGTALSPTQARVLRAHPFVVW